VNKLFAVWGFLIAVCGCVGHSPADRGHSLGRPLLEVRPVDAPQRPVFSTAPPTIYETASFQDTPSPPLLTAPSTCTDARSERGFYGLYRTDAGPKGEVALTFDDGPHPTATPSVLKLLARHGRKATFFLVGRNISRDTYSMVQQMVAEGHALGSHSYSHNVHMTNVATPEATIEDIVAQHEVTAILIDIALLAVSPDDFDLRFTRVFDSSPSTWLSGSTLRKHWETYRSRHASELVQAGYSAGSRPYRVIYSRPPGGGPYVEHDGSAGIALYDRALARLKMMNVMWHSASGDTVPEKRSDFGFLTENLAKGTRQGGVVLIHDYMRPDALEHSLRQMARDGVRTVTLGSAVSAKYGCDENALSALLQGPRPN
jgi:hypothetical protein